MSTPAQRLLLVLPSLERGGGERVLLQLAGLFAEAGREVYLAVLLGGGPLRSQVPASVVLHELVSGTSAARGFALARHALPKLVSLMRALKPDAVLSTMTGTNLLTVAACMLARASSRLVLREAASLVNTKSAMTRLAMRCLYRRADASVAVSKGVARDLRGLGLAAARVHVIHNPVDADRLRQLAAAGLPSALDGKTPYVVSVGRLSEQKDQATLLRAFAQSGLRDNHYLVIVGGGYLDKALEALAKDLGIGGRVVLTGSLDNPFPVLARGALHVLSSLWEGYPNVLLEALALGVPVVATDCPYGPREMLHDGHYGRLVPMQDPAALACAMEDEIARPSNRADRVVDQHAPRAIAAAYLAILDDAQRVPQP